MKFVLLLLSASVGFGQTVTCTFRFVASGTVGLQYFTNASVIVTTVGFTGNTYPNYTYPYGISGYRMNNTSATIAVSGVGTYHANLLTTNAVAYPWVASLYPPVNGTPVTQNISFLSHDGATSVGIDAPTSVGAEWNLLETFSTTATSGLIGSTDGNMSPFQITTAEDYVLMFYYASPVPITFQATLSPGVPCTGTPMGNAADVQAIVYEALGMNPINTDMNGDGVVNVVDVQAVTSAVLGCGPLPVRPFWY